MAIAPALPWRKASGELLRHRLQWPAWVGTATIVACLLAGLRGLAPVLAFGLAGFAGAAAVRQLVLATRRSWRDGSGVWRGIVGRANGGMIVHLGVIVIAVAFSASQAYGQHQDFRLAPGQSARLDGHTITFLGMSTHPHPNRASEVASIRVDGGRVYTPAISQYPNAAEGIGTPSVRSSLVDDVYLTVEATPGAPDGPAVIGLFVQPLVLWLWIGGGMVAFGTILAALPGRRRRRPTAPASAPGLFEERLEREPVLSA
jgi:cytochrome c-type biogenesis protein CcmF